MNDQREHPSSSPPVYVRVCVCPGLSTYVTDVPFSTYVTNVFERCVLFEKCLFSGKSEIQSRETVVSRDFGRFCGNVLPKDTHFGDACLIWQLAQLRVHGHALRRSDLGDTISHLLEPSIMIDPRTKGPGPRAGESSLRRAQNKKF